eukprot:759327-Hanusia_phi.AAC.12
MNTKRLINLDDMCLSLFLNYDKSSTPTSESSGPPVIRRKLARQGTFDTHGRGKNTNILMTSLHDIVEFYDVSLKPIFQRSSLLLLPNLLTHTDTSLPGVVLSTGRESGPRICACRSSISKVLKKRGLTGIPDARAGSKLSPGPAGQGWSGD